MKPARNDLCFCGSGKKFKKCCIDKPVFPPVTPIKAAAPTQAECAEIISLYNSGQRGELERKAKLLIDLYPQSGVAWKLWGASLQLLGREDALAALLKATQLQPDDAEAHNFLGITYIGLGKKTEAEACYRRVLEINPYLAATLCNLAGILTSDGRFAEAEVHLRQALAVNPNMAEAHQNLCAVLLKLGRPDDALQSALAAVALRPDLPDAHFNLGIMQVEMKRLEEAEASFRRTLALAPGHAQACISIGSVLTMRGDLHQAEEFFRLAIALDHRLTEAHIGLSSVLFDLRRLDDAEAILRQALQVNPDNGVIYSNLGPVLTRMGRLDEAVIAFQMALQRAPAHAAAYNGFGVTLKLLGRQNEGQAAFRRAVELAPCDVAAHSNLLSALNFIPETSNDDTIALARSFDQKFCLPHRDKLPPHTNNKEPGRRLRIGYVSPDFRHHAVAYYLEPILANHDKSQVEVFCYAEEKRTDEYTERFRQLADHWRPTRTLDDDAMARCIRADQIDILIDLCGHTEDNRLLAFARKPAPVQFTYLGYPGTTGLSAIDYRIVDHYAAPEGIAEAAYTEQLLRMPDSLWCYRPTADMPEPGRLPALDKGYLTFGSFNNFNKMDDATLDLWTELLRQIPDSHLMILTVPVGEARQRLTQRFAAGGIDAARLGFHGKMGHSEFHQRFLEVDISLDPLNVNGATTTCESLWMGVPVISLVGSRFLTRAGLSLMSAAGVGEFAVNSRADYIRIASELAADLPRLAALRVGLRARMMASPLTDAVRFTQNLENLYREAWRRWCTAS